MNLYDMLLAQKLGGVEVDIETLSVTANGEYIAPSGKAYSPVNVLVPNSYSAGDEGKVVSNGALVAQSSQNIDTNGTYDTTLKDEIVVNVSGGGGSSNVVMGSFKFDTAGAHDVSIPYSGNGFITDIVIYPKEAHSAAYSSAQLNSFFMVSMTKTNSNSPNYSWDTGGDNNAEGTQLYIRSSATNFRSKEFNTEMMYYDNDATATGIALKVRNKNTMSVYINNTNAAGWIAGVEYEYIATYSS